MCDFPNGHLPIIRGGSSSLKRGVKLPIKLLWRGEHGAKLCEQGGGAGGAEPPTILFKEIALRVSNLSAQKIFKYFVQVSEAWQIFI